MSTPKGLVFVHGYGMSVPNSVQAEAERLKESITRNCVGPYEDNGIAFFISLVVEGKTGVPFNFYGIRSYPVKNNAICVDIRVKKAEWEVPLVIYRQFLWCNFEEASLLCVEKLKKKKVVVDEARLRGHLALVKSEFLGNGFKSGALDPAIKTELMPVDRYTKDEKQRLIVQYRVEGDGRCSDLDKRGVVENLLGGFLEEADLGYCDGGDIGSGTMNIFCFAKPGRGVGKRMIEVLRKNSLLDGATIVETVEENERVIWPPDYAGEFSLM